jgi:protein phosphatase
MIEESTTAPITSAAISDRGLSDKRPLNEDSFLADETRRIFVVADGVGGAQAGEVASQTAVEVLDEAFRHQESGSDIEDLMEIAIQRANASIHQMSRDHPKLSMMATTVVALHLDGYVATIGHVGDSRLYRLTPAGKLLRETEDHSMVEEEVRAGRMTPDQALHHPSRNVISRALGAEPAVDVDTKTVEVEDGTAFLLCSDGITRHIPDEELRQLLASGDDLDQICQKMKRLCYERGAEDNLTALIIRVGQFKAVASKDLFDDERTIAAKSTAAMARDSSAGGNDGAPDSEMEGNNLSTQKANTKTASRQIISLEPPSSETQTRENAPLAQALPRRNLAGTLPLVLLVAVVSAAAAFYGGMAYRDRQSQQAETAASTTTVPAAMTAPESAEAKYEKLRREVDRTPQEFVSRMAAESNGKPFESADPEFLYLYGRALMLSGKHAEATEAFKKAVEKLGANSPIGRDPLKIEARISAAAAALESRNPAAQAIAAKDLNEVIQTENAAGAAQPAISPGR